MHRSEYTRQTMQVSCTLHDIENAWVETCRDQSSWFCSVGNRTRNKSHAQKPFAIHRLVLKSPHSQVLQTFVNWKNLWWQTSQGQFYRWPWVIKGDAVTQWSAIVNLSPVISKAHASRNGTQRKSVHILKIISLIYCRWDFEKLSSKELVLTWLSLMSVTPTVNFGRWCIICCVYFQQSLPPQAGTPILKVLAWIHRKWSFFNGPCCSLFPFLKNPLGKRSRSFSYTHKECHHSILIFTVLQRTSTLT